MVKTTNLFLQCTKFFVVICDCDTFLCFDKSLTESLTVLASIPANTFDLGLIDHLPPSCPSSSCRSSQTGRKKYKNSGHTRALWWFYLMMLALQALMTLGFEAKSTDILANMQQRLIKCTARFVAESVVTSS